MADAHCPRCGAADHAWVRVGGVTYIGCPLVGESETLILDPGSFRVLMAAVEPHAVYPIHEHDHGEEGESERRER